MIHLPILLGIKVAAAIYQARAQAAAAAARAADDKPAPNPTVAGKHVTDRKRVVRPEKPFTSMGSPIPGHPGAGRENANPVSASVKLEGGLDAAECGGYQLSLYGYNFGTQLQVAGPERGQFEVGGLRLGAEVTLHTASGTPTSIVVRRDGVNSYSVCVRERPPSGVASLQAIN